MESCKVEDFPLFSDLTDEESAMIQTHWKERHYKKGQSLFIKGRPCMQTFFVRSGQVKLTLLSSTGKEQIIETLGPGDNCACHPPGSSGENGCWSCSVHGEALTDCHVYSISTDSLVRLFEKIPSLQQRLNAQLADKLRSYTDLIEDISLRPSFQRVAHYLVNNSVTFSQEELSRRLGIARETASRHLNRLKRMKLIDIKPQEIVVLDKRGLEVLVHGNDPVGAAV